MEAAHREKREDERNVLRDTNTNVLFPLLACHVAWCNMKHTEQSIVTGYREERAGFALKKRGNHAGLRKDKLGQK